MVEAMNAMFGIIVAMENAMFDYYYYYFDVVADVVVVVVVVVVVGIEVKTKKMNLMTSSTS